MNTFWFKEAALLVILSLLCFFFLLPNWASDCLFHFQRPFRDTDRQMCVFAGLRPASVSAASPTSRTLSSFALTDYTDLTERCFWPSSPPDLGCLDCSDSCFFLSDTLIYSTKWFVCLFFCSSSWCNEHMVSLVFLPCILIKILWDAALSATRG